MKTTLTPEQQRIAQAMQLNVNRPIDDLLQMLGGLAAFDQEIAARRKKAGTILGLSILFSVAGISVSIKHLADTHPHLGIYIVMTVAAIVIAIVSGVIYVRLKKADLSDDLQNSAIPFLTLLREDMNPRDAIHVKIDLRSAAVKEKKVRENKVKDPRFFRVVERFFVNPWFSGNVVLADGTHVDWEVIDKLLQRVRTRRNPRGKYKTKTKEKWHIVGAVSVGFPTKHYAVGEAGADEKRHTVKLKRKIKVDYKTGTPAFELLVDLIAEAYSGVAVAKRS